MTNSIVLGDGETNRLLRDSIESTPPLPGHITQLLQDPIYVHHSKLSSYSAAKANVQSIYSKPLDIESNAVDPAITDIESTKSAMDSDHSIFEGRSDETEYIDSNSSWSDLTDSNAMSTWRMMQIFIMLLVLCWNIWCFVCCCLKPTLPTHRALESTSFDIESKYQLKLSSYSSDSAMEDIS